MRSSSPNDKFSYKSNDSGELAEDHQDESEENGIVILPSGPQKFKSRLIKYKRPILFFAIIFVLVFILIVAKYQKPLPKDEVEHKVPFQNVIDPAPDPVLELYPSWLDGIPVEDPAYARFSGPSPFKNEALAVKEKYLDEILRTDYNISDDPQRKMLIIILTSADNFQRRQIVRAHQIHPYRSYTNVTWKFVLGNPDEVYRGVLKFENDTYGDLLFLETVPDTRDLARSIKLLEFYKYVEEHLPVYRYIGKIDTDCFVNIADLMKYYFSEEVDKYDLVSIAAVVRLGKLNWPQGGFFTFSYKLMLMVNRLYALVPRTVYEEDFQIGWYLNDAEVDYVRVDLPMGTPVAYDFNFNYRNVFENTIKVHELKGEPDYIRVANCFDMGGANMTQILKMRAVDWK